MNTQLVRDNAESIRSILAEHLPWSPVGFIRKVNAAGDRSIYAEALISELADNDDMRFLHRTSDGDDVAVFARGLPWDTAFFGREIARLDGVFPLTEPFYRPGADYAPALFELVQRARSRGTGYLYATVDPRDLATLRALGELGFGLIETRAFYHRDLSDLPGAERYGVRAATAADIESLSLTAREMVNPYDRFHADPFFDREAVDQFMSRWVEASIAGGFADVTIVPDADRPTAFCTVKYHEEHWDRWGLRLSQPVLSAVGPNFKGWHRKIISEIGYHLRDHGAEHSYLATQVTNGAVIWVWESLGYQFGKGEHIMRIAL